VHGALGTIHQHDDDDDDDDVMTVNRELCHTKKSCIVLSMFLKYFSISSVKI